MIPRYTHLEMEKLWLPEAKFAGWLAVEMAAAEAMAEIGMVPRDASQRLAKAAEAIKFDDQAVQEIDDIERTTRHDIIAFLTFLERRLGEDSRWLHLGLTSSDVLDTSMAVTLKQACDLLLADLDNLMAVLKRQALTHKNTVMIGRTHGIHAEPITFGLKLALWHEMAGRDRRRLEAARAAIAVGKISGAVGTFAHLPPAVEAHVCRRLGLEPAKVSNQVVQRDRHAELFSALAICGGTLEKIVLDIRLMQRTEAGEVEEFFQPGQKGSSAMPHKRNPVLSENVAGLARLVRGYAAMAFENVALWQERDISHSSVERVIGPDATLALDFALRRVTGLLERLIVYPERMRRNMDATHGLFFSEGLMLSLISKGVLRQTAYELVQRNAMRAIQERIDFKTLLLTDDEVRRFLATEEIEELFTMEHTLRHVDAIFARVFP